ncbi:MAG TPA: FHA domain-containing protein [Anaerolineaceae bacterium]|jgi:predicted component of type VI protein secretion system|nr:FHA domain-containing protein [Chloroflexota bacterium]HNS06704.1 FHA domain-containing protein [Anaerolineaceae bacterium]HOQ68922.1 FHA domain-containing protein [Anaerolineaceae bacterium]HOS54354.1 FHA domain-containing protein [Anaerolineaceae bacterium]HPD63600.1 FHA domain-containing protein [Anaerolineaceae bacterium]
MANFRLILQSGSAAGTEYPLEKTEIYLGRDLSNDVVINDPEVSRRHARLVLTGNTYVIEDLGSTNGTFLRGQRLSAPMLLNPGETITIGENVLLKFEGASIDPNATVAAFRRSSAEPVTSAAPAQQPFVPQQPAAPRYTPAQPAAPQYGAPQPAAPQFVPQQPVTPPFATPQPAPPVHAAVGGASPAPYAPTAKKKSGWLIALLVVVGVLLIFCIVPWLIIEVTDSYCALFPGIFNSIQPGVCP